MAHVGYMLLSIILSAVVLLLAPHPTHAALNMNCTAAGVVGTDCMTHMRWALAAFIYDEKGYSQRNIPVRDPADSIDVGAFMTFFHLSEVNQVEGRIAMSIYIDLFWKDVYIQWDPKWTDGIDSLFVDPDLLWKPDIQLYNTVNVYEETMDQTAQLWIEATSDVWWSRPGAINAACLFDLEDFPFDSQSCNVTFGSFMYDELMLNFSLYSYEDLGDTVIRDAFRSLTWNVDSIKPHVRREMNYGYEFTLITWTIDLTRYYEYYISNAILPSLVVTLISLGALWIPDVQNRLALAVTALLTIVAVQWTVSATLPVTEKTTWLADFSNLCIIYVAMICGECCLVAYMGAKKGPPPKWVKAVIIISNIAKVTRKYLYATAESYMWWKRRQRARSSSMQHSINNSHSADSGSGSGTTHSPMSNADNVEMSGLAIGASSNSVPPVGGATINNSNTSRMSGRILRGVDSDDEDEGETRDVEGVTHRRRGVSQSVSEQPSVKSERLLKIERAALAGDGGDPGAGTDDDASLSKGPKYSWERGARAIDRLSRVVLPISFILIMLSSYYF